MEGIFRYNENKKKRRENNDTNQPVTATTLLNQTNAYAGSNVTT